MEAPVAHTISRPSRIPSYRIQDLRFNPSTPTPTPSDEVSPALQNSLHRLPVANPLRLGESIERSSIWSGSEGRDNNAKSAGNATNVTSTHNRTNSANIAVTPYPNRPRLLPRSISFPLPSASFSPSSPTVAVNIDLVSHEHNQSLSSPHQPHVNALHNQHVPTVTKQKAGVYRRHNNGLDKGSPSRPPPAMITQGSYKLEIDTTSTTDWVASQQIAPSPLTSRSQPPPSPAQPTSARSFNSSGSRPLIRPIRGFKPSSRKSMDMAFRQTSGDADDTLRALEGYDRSGGISNSPEQDTSDDSDLFLRAAKEEELSRHASNGPAESVRKRSRIGQRSSLPPSNNLFQGSISQRRGSDLASNASRTQDEQGNRSIGQALTYHPSERSRASTALDSVNRSRFYGSNINSSPTTSRATREPLQESGYQGRRGSLPDPSYVLPSRLSSYRQSNLSYSTPRNRNSSPLVSRATDMQDTPVTETARAAEGTESTVSTTAPSTVWDELEDLKSRIHRLELTGKLPATSGAAMSRASHDRPPTAGTTATTMSTSPKQRGSGNNSSPVEANQPLQPGEIHPLLHSALAKSKPLLSPDVFGALAATANDALGLAAMMGTSGQPGPMSSAQSTIDHPASGVSDRQVRRKADSMCRSLTELCLALSDGKTEQSASTETQVSVRPRSSGRDQVLQSIEPSDLPRKPISTDVARTKASPRALSRLEERRSSLLNNSMLPSPRYGQLQEGQSSVAGRRTSLLIRPRRGNTEEPEEDITRFRAPSRAITEIGRFRDVQGGNFSDEPSPERNQTILSSLPVRRNYHVATSSLPNTGPTTTAPQSTISGARRYLDRATPEREVTAPVGRLLDTREVRKSSLGGFGLGRTGSINRRLRPSTNNNSPNAGQGYQ